MRTEIYTRSLDELQTDLLILTLFQNEHPPKKMAGLVDWRLNGFLSRKILDSSIRGNFGEKVLIPLYPRLPARRLLLMGLGKKEEFHSARAEELGRKLGNIISRLKTVDVAVYVPPSVEERIVGSTQRAIMDAISLAPQADNLLLRWIDSVSVSPEIFLLTLSEKSSMDRPVRRTNEKRVS